MLGYFGKVGLIMKRNLFPVALAGLALLCAGCSKTKPVRIMSASWAVGKHQDCIYAQQGLYCLPTSMKMFRQYNLEGFYDKDKKKLPKTDGIFILGVDIVHYMERNRAEAEKDPSGETGTFETSFSGRASEYSVWDCYKTGSGSPAIACQLTKDPDSKARDSIAKKEEAIKVDDVLLGLTPAALTKACPNPQATSLDDLYQIFKYPSTRPEIPTTLKFENPRLGSNHLYSVETEEPKGADGRYSKQHVFWLRAYDSLSDAGRVGEQLPCINK